MRKLLYLLVVLIVVLLGLAFVYLNQQLVTVDYWGSQYWGGSWEVPLSLLVIVTFVAGMLIGYLFNTASNLRLRGKLMSSNRKLKKVELVD